MCRRLKEMHETEEKKKYMNDQKKESSKGKKEHQEIVADPGFPRGGCSTVKVIMK